LKKEAQEKLCFEFWAPRRARKKKKGWVTFRPERSLDVSELWFGTTGGWKVMLTGGFVMVGRAG